MSSEMITVSSTVLAPIAVVWDAWTSPEHIVRWNAASDDWHTPSAENDLRVGGRFTSRMEAKDGSMGFDFGGEYTADDHHRLIAYELDDGREVSVHFDEAENGVRVTETFEAEATHSVEMQRSGWQSILYNFKAYTESLA